nr:protein RKD1-like [Ipomoea batatas]
MEISNGSVEDNKKGKKSGSGVEEKCCISKTLSRETVSNYFYMPISQAAKELNIGLTLLKKRCRELGIRRWPHRKLMSLESLIKNVQELGKNQGEGKIREAIKVLENERKLLLRTPDLQLDETTKRLRQACFKANYKKRRLVGMVDSSSSSSNANSSCVPISTLGLREKINTSSLPRLTLAVTQLQDHHRSLSPPSSPSSSTSLGSLNPPSNEEILISLVKSSTQRCHLLQIHAYLLRTCLLRNHLVCSAFLSRLSLPPFQDFFRIWVMPGECSINCQDAMCHLTTL